MDINKVIISGYVATKPEFTEKENGTSFCRFILATNNNYYNKAGDKIENTLWHSVVIYGKSSNSFHKNVTVGAKVLIDGKSTPYEYTRDEEKRWGHSLSTLGYTVLVWPKDKPTKDQAASLSETPNLPEDLKSHVRDYDLTSETSFTVNDIPF